MANVMGLETEMLCKLFFLTLLKAQKFCKNTVDPKVLGGEGDSGEKNYNHQQEKHTRISKKEILRMSVFSLFFLNKYVSIASATIEQVSSAQVLPSNWKIT